MNNTFKEIDTKNRKYYFLDDMVNINNLDPKKIKIDEKHREILLFTTSDM